MQKKKQEVQIIVQHDTENYKTETFLKENVFFSSTGHKYKLTTWSLYYTNVV